MRWTGMGAANLIECASVKHSECVCGEKSRENERGKDES